MAVRLDVEVEDRDDVRVAQPGAGTALAHEALARAPSTPVSARMILIATSSPSSSAPGAVDRTHPAFGQRRQDFVTAVEDLAGGEHDVNLITSGMAGAKWAKRARAPGHRSVTLLPTISSAMPPTRARPPRTGGSGMVSWRVRVA